jgi:hypothetical protein
LSLLHLTMLTKVQQPFICFIVLVDANIFLHVT